MKLSKGWNGSRVAIATIGAILVTSVLGALPVKAESLYGPTTAVVRSVSSDAADSEALTYMREEEKLAHDVYVTLYDLWGLRVFDNISRAESQHMSAVLLELDSLGLADPAAGKATGEFANAELQALYDDLIAQGSESVVEALLVGATIEEVDIADLLDALDSTSDDDVRFVFENLLRSSENHLRAFAGNLARHGESYTPQYIDAEYFASIVDTGSLSGRYGRSARNDGVSGQDMSTGSRSRGSR